MFNKIHKYLFSAIISITFLLITVNRVIAQESPTRLIIFYGQGCPHCERANAYLNTLENKYKGIKFERLEVYYNVDNQRKMSQIAQELNVEANGVPLIVVDNDPFIGFGDSETTGLLIEQSLEKSLGISIDAPPPTKSDESSLPENSGSKVSNDKLIYLPILGSVDTKALSLPFLTVIIGFLDGFNPCAMWVLLFLITSLISVESKKRRWGIGLLFILSSGFVYYLFLATWLNIFMFLSIVTWIKTIIGIVAIAIGSYLLRDFYINKSGGCNVVDEKQRRYFFSRIKNVVNERRILYIIPAVVVLAFSVNIIELVCSAGLPAIYTHVLSLSNLSSFQYYFYLLIYVVFFMLDDILIFALAMFTLQTVGIEKRYVRFSHLVGGIIMLVLGILLIFKPEVLMFG